MLTVLIMLLTLSSIAGLAAAGENPKDQGVFKLGDMVVTGDSAVAAAVNTNEAISMEDLQLNNSITVGEALTTLPGVFSTIGTKNEQYFTIRGFNQRYVPIFYDGIPISVPYDGYVDAGVLSTDNLSRITVSKGLSSVLYGPNSMGGVINLVTRKPEKAFEGDLTLGAQEVDGYRAALNLGSRVGDWYMMLGASTLDVRTFNLSSDFKDTRNESGDTRNNASKKTNTGSFKIGWLPAEGHEYAIGVNIVDADRDVPPHTTAASGRELKYWRFTDWDKLTTYFIGNSRLTEGLELKTRLFHDDYENTLDAYDNASYSTQNGKMAFHSSYDDYSWGGSVSLCSKQLARQQISLAFHYKEDVHKSQGDYGEKWERYEAATYSMALEDLVQITDYLDVVMGASYDIQDPEYANGGKVRSSNDSFNPQIGLRWALNDRLTAHASVGSKSRFPTLSELYSSYLDSSIPNPDLEKETAINYEVGVEYNPASHTLLTLALFYSDVEDLIVRRSLPAGDMYDNVGKARFQGVEAGVVSSFLPRQEITAHYTYLDADNRSADRVNDHIEEVSKNKFFISDLIKITDRIHLFAKCEWFDKRWEEDVNGAWQELDGFTLVDAKVMVELPRQVDLEVGFRNLFDENYELSAGFPRPGRTAFAELKYSF
ncbi:MAG: TonB-dependent receptor [Deltaproteobacteria bacterium]|nr:TonB-dependent receptor [Deltaproteobacteria bacterium]